MPDWNIMSENNLAKMRDLLGLLLSAPSITVGKLYRSPNHQFHGVYLFLTPDESQILYVGRTSTKTLAGRMADHRAGYSYKDLKLMIRKYPDMPQNVEEYKARCIRVDDLHERGFFEDFAKAALKPPFNSYR